MEEMQKVVHGQWLINPDGYYIYCSECQTEPFSGKMTKFCPECGAIMDGVKRMTIEKAIEMIDEYLMEPNSISADWVEVLKLCRKVLVEKELTFNVTDGDNE